MCEHDSTDDTTEINPECHDDGGRDSAGTAGDTQGRPRDYAERDKWPGSLFKSVCEKLFDQDQHAADDDMTGHGHHPGTYLRELLVWHAISAEELARRTEIPCSMIVELTAARRPVDRRISRGLAGYFGNSAQFWLDLQARFDRRNPNNRAGPW